MAHGTNAIPRRADARFYGSARYLSAHSETEISSGGAKCLTIDANKASSLLAAVASIVRRIFSTFPALPLTDALFVCFCVIFIV